MDHCSVIKACVKLYYLSQAGHEIYDNNFGNGSFKQMHQLNNLFVPGYVNMYMCVSWLCQHVAQLCTPSVTIHLFHLAYSFMNLYLPLAHMTNTVLA